MNHTEHNYDSIGTRLSIVLLVFIGYMFLLFLPALVGGFIDDLGFSPEQAGVVASSHLFGVIVGALVAGMLITRVNLRIALSTCAVAEALMLLLISRTGSVEMMYGLQFVAGCFAGIIAGIGLAAIALTSNPDRVSGLALFTQFLIGAIGLSLIHLISFKQGIYVLSAFAASGLIWAHNMPSRIGDAAAERQDRAVSKVFTVPIMLALLALFAFYSFNNSLWPYLDRIAVALQIAEADIASGLGLSMIGGLVGAGITTFLGNRFGRTIPSIIALVLISASAFMLLKGKPGDTMVFFIASFMFNAMLAMLVPFILGFCAEQDTSGRAMSLANLCLAGGIATGPALGAALISGDSYDYLLLVAGIGMMACLLPLLLAYILADNKANEDKFHEMV